MCRNKTYAKRRQSGLCAGCGNVESESFRCGECQWKLNRAVSISRKRKRQSEKQDKGVASESGQQAGSIDSTRDIFQVLVLRGSDREAERHAGGFAR